MELMVETDSGSGKKRVGWREIKGNLEGEPTNNLKRKHRLKSLRKESNDFARVEWVLDYGLRFRKEEQGGREKQRQLGRGNDE